MRVSHPTTADVLAAQAVVAMLEGTGVSPDPDVVRLATLDPWAQPDEGSDSTAVA